MTLYLLFGSPTVELFVASYNKRSNGTNTVKLGMGEGGYSHSTQPREFFKKEENHGIYNKDGESCVWIASPDGSGYQYKNYGLNMYGDWGSFAYRAVDFFDDYIRPVVCIPTTVFNEKYLSSFVDDNN